MAYLTHQDMIDRFGDDALIQLTDRADPPTDAIDPVVLGQAIADAEELINGYVAGRYAVPLTPVPELVKRLGADLAFYFLHGDMAAELVVDRHDKAIATLKQISTGTITLQAAGVAAPSSQIADEGVVYDGPGRVFSAKSLGTF
jgi:phage gp36-like protein